MICSFCGTIFKEKHILEKYCSNACRYKTNYSRNKENIKRNVKNWVNNNKEKRKEYAHQHYLIRIKYNEELSEQLILSKLKYCDRFPSILEREED